MTKLHPAVQTLLADIEAYRAKVGISRSEFGRAVTGDGYLIWRLERGRRHGWTPSTGSRRYIDQRTKAASQWTRPA